MMSARPGSTGPAPGVWYLIREDFRTYKGSAVQPGMHALVLHRLGQASYAGTTARHRLGRFVYRLGRVVVAGVYNIEIPVQTQVGRRLHLPHPHGVVLNGRAVIGDDCMIRHNVTIGAGSDRPDALSPVIGDRVQFGPGAVVMGGITVGDDVLIGPNAVVIADVPAGSRVLAPVAGMRQPGGASGPSTGGATVEPP